MEAVEEFEEDARDAGESAEIDLAEHVLARSVENFELRVQRANFMDEEANQDFDGLKSFWCQNQ